MSTESHDITAVKILLKSYRQINALYEASSQLVQISQWIYYMQTGKMYNLVEEND